MSVMYGGNSRGIHVYNDSTLKLNNLNLTVMDCLTSYSNEITVAMQSPAKSTLVQQMCLKHLARTSTILGT